MRHADPSGASDRAWWWPSRSDDDQALPSSETELVSAAILCAALAETKTTPSDASTHSDAAARELEAHIRQSPLPHALMLPVLEFTADYVLVESAAALVCAVRATKPSDILDAVVNSAVPISKPFVHRFGGVRVHAPFWKRAKRLRVSELYNKARNVNKPLLLCGHSIGGSIAQLALCELAFQELPTSTRLFLEKKDASDGDKDAKTKKELSLSQWLQQHAGETERVAVAASIPQVVAVGFGSPYAGCQELGEFVDALKVQHRLVTFVNEFDCVPGILNVAQSAAMLSNTTDRLKTIAKATTLLMNLLPAKMQQHLLNVTVAAGTGAVPSAASAYLTMSITVLQKVFEKLRDFKVVKGIDYAYAPCGTYIFLTKGSAAFMMHSDPSSIRKALREEDDDHSLTGNSVLQHYMREYVSAVARRSQSIQINATMNFYERLGVPRTATPQQIRSAYKSLALKWHPDRWAGAAVTVDERSTAEDVFKLLAESYEVLSNTSARQAYDTHLNKAPSLREEFMTSGTVKGKSLDEAIATFRDVIDNITSATSRVTSHFSSSSTTMVGHPVQPNGLSMTTSNAVKAPTSHTCTNSHDHTSLFSAEPVHVSAVGVGAENAHEHLTLFQADDALLPTDIRPQALSTSSTTSSTSTASSSSSGSSSISTGLRSISVVGGAVAVAVSVAVIVHAWSQFTDASRKKRQRSVVREMPAECLLLLLEDHRSTQSGRASVSTLFLEASALKKKRPALSHGKPLAVVGEETALVNNDFQHALAERTQRQQEEDELVEQFFECETRYEEASVEAQAEEQFYDCVELGLEVDEHFSGTRAKQAGDVQQFPVGSAVNTPFGLGVVAAWGSSRTAATVRFPSKDDALHCISTSDISRGASLALVDISSELEARRTAIADCVIDNYHLEDTQRKRDTLKSLAVVGADGAIDTGMRAAGGVVLVNGMTRTTTAMGGMVAAPLAVASILVDIGKEYYDYRKKFSERESLRVLSATSERLLRREFRLKMGEVVVSRTAAAAGAGLSAYGVASAMGMWAAAGVATGPIGIAAATSAAVIGGVIGYFSGSKVYSLSTKSYFTSHKHAKEHIDRLELGARILFEEFDPTGTGEISKEDCLIIMTKLYEASGGMSDKGYEKTVAALADPNFQGPVTWRMFWLWVSSEASRALHDLDTNRKERSQSRHSPTRERKRDLIRKVISDAKHKRKDIKELGHELVAIAKSDKRRRPSPAAAAESGQLSWDEQLDVLVRHGHFSAAEAREMRKQLESKDPKLRATAHEVIGALIVEEVEPESELYIKDKLVDESAGASLVPAPVSPVATETAPLSKEAARAATARKKAPVDERLDVLCSLLSAPGIERFLARQNIVPEENATPPSHEELHCLALATAVAPAAPAHS